MEPLPLLPFRDQALQDPDSVKHLFDSGKIEKSLREALIEHVAKKEEDRMYLALFLNQPQAIADMVNVFASLIATQLKMENELDKIDFQFEDVATAYVGVDDGVHVIHLPIKQTVMSIAIDPTDFSWMAWALAHEFFHIYIDKRYKKHGDMSKAANIIGLLFGDPALYNRDMGEIACELYSIDFMRKLAAHLDSKHLQRATELRNRANEVEAQVKPRIEGRFGEAKVD